MSSELEKAIKERDDLKNKLRVAQDRVNEIRELEKIDKNNLRIETTRKTVEGWTELRLSDNMSKLFKKILLIKDEFDFNVKRVNKIKIENIGLNDVESYVLNQRALGLSRLDISKSILSTQERVRQIESNAVTKIRRANSKYKFEIVDCAVVNKSTTTGEIFTILFLGTKDECIAYFKSEWNSKKYPFGKDKYMMIEIVSSDLNSI